MGNDRGMSPTGGDGGRSGRVEKGLSRPRRRRRTWRWPWTREESGNMVVLGVVVDGSRE